MREWSVALGLSAALLSVQPSYATKLIGTPLLLTQQYASDTGDIIETLKGDIGVSYTGFDQENQVQGVFLQFLNRKLLKGDRLLVVDARPEGAKFQGISSTSALFFNDGKASVFFEGYRDISIASERGFYSQPMKRSGLAGKTHSYDKVKNLPALWGIARKLSSRNVVIYEGDYSRDRHIVAQFVDNAGNLDGAPIDISRPGYGIHDASAIEDGFIVTYRKTSMYKYTSNIVAQRFDVAGNKVGSEYRLEYQTHIIDAPYTRAYGLADGSVLVLRSRHGKGGRATITGEVLDRDWNVKVAETIIGDGLLSQKYAAAPLPSGGFLLADYHTSDAPYRGEIKVKTFSSDLIQSDKAAVIPTINGAYADQIVVRASGDAVVLFSVSHSLGLARDLSAQFVEP